MSEQNTSSRSKINTHPDRSIADRDWIIAFLRRAGMCSIATAQGDQPFISTLLFAYDEPANAIYFHTARRGRVWQNIHADPKANPRLCLSAAEMGRLLPAETALNFSVEYQSVVVFGTARLVEDFEVARRSLQLILDKYFPHLQPGTHYRPVTNEELRATAVYRLDIEEWSAKRKTAPDNFPGAITWKQPK